MDSTSASTSITATPPATPPSTSVTATPPSTEARAPFRRRRWLRRVLIIGAIAILAPVLIYSYIAYTTRSAWADAEAEAALEDPRWKLLEIEADRRKIPDNENSARHAMATVSLARGFHVSSVKEYDRVFDKLPPAVQLNTQQIQLIRGQLAKQPKALVEARKLKDMPYGRFPIVYSDDFICTLIPNQQETRQLADWLSNDAMLLAQDRDFDEAVESCQAILNAGRTIGDEPTLISFLIRAALQAISVTTLERVLAQSHEPISDKTLAAMQALLEKEMNECSWVQGMRGERAGQHYLFENIRAGKVDPNNLRSLISFSPPGQAGPGDFIDGALVEIYPRSMLTSYPAHLRYMNRVVAAAKLPIDQRGPALKKLDDEMRASGSQATRIFAPAMMKVERADTRNQLYLRTALIGVACERYRLQREDGRWPETLDDLVKAKLLDKLPIDPLHKEPFHYRRHADYIVIYSKGLDGTDDGGNIDRDRIHEPGVDIGFRLWHLERRRQTPLPPVIIGNE
jgi:hypothetical protein